MGLQIETVRYQSGEHSGYFAMLERAAGPLPAVIVIHEAWGVNEHIEDVTRRFARAGYAALAPDLFSKGGERPAPLARERLAELLEFVNRHSPVVLLDEKRRNDELSKLPADVKQRLTESFGALFGGQVGPMRLNAHLPAVLATTKFLREEHAPTRGQPIASVGFCMGGGLSALLACHDPQLAAAVVYYGAAPPAELVPKIQCPLFGFYGGEDKRINDNIPAFAEAMKRTGRRFESRIYPGAQHAFFNDNRPVFDVRAARDAYARTLQILLEHLTQIPGVRSASGP
jgi:carboxymethylenebutenolidase